ncbi:hypothetical protein LOY37_18300 [Pseudomonas sp. B21-012]|uniref:hypothetical protein n=1 Tax=unclassified Pseudomonas TaxID=196821 RepID=UPI001BD15D5B|nr:MULTISPECIES: hypothetical protein [unclassified Pseudomonas]QVM98372.1 hypothetical protein JYG36_09450 [Pseudomonas sp. SORT22]UVM54302.1 hypothetical protein LOY37_18300 [Pseudomonas sp. B21-012]
MQQQHYILALAALWLFTLAFLPFLFAKARTRAFDSGRAAGLETRDAINSQRIASIRIERDELAIQLEAEQRKHLTIKAALQGRVKELEDRIMSYTDMPVTRADHDLLTKTANTLKLAGRTWKALHVDPQTQHANDQQRYIEELAARVHAQLRITPAKPTDTGEAA